jgi:hypothetical protein
MAWMTAVFNDRFAFGCTAFDNPETDPDWKGSLELPGGQSVKGGWVCKDGEMVPILSAMKKTVRNRETLFPESVEMTLNAANGRSYAVSGQVIAAGDWRTWHNFQSIICLVRWECDGLVTHGDFQECQWADYIRLLHM